ncbi:MAG: glycine cleavage system protein H [SAR86 cluster bacterium BACL1 MAG-121105-bin34]|jgi:glycine cleavage system H protein|uniref:Glycine cleavage system H protein n=2 Tax=SAR86 cluster TaxID=62672 RepID=A0A0R2UAR3_9GAMM|nr:MAG: glycine cleavage system protein H [SAR86 cluster bacterium BACL1 MAG-120507-bin14]KRO41320.1 MAG: glycine cleavage system protein H [SAR86 cluster bacterium BACL1 MAG-120920-bin57]KRO96152.1 MAG: glycine cleavage system protein H [SAR86 cluster bacterium BACL1 MAG-120820-bin45]KRO97426.1 MAG: glycine cleavage system protein H [SAR86 cluster bacterium BACL1 MAG-120828-bin5]KRO98843.1 MAG: glycine cleavage system protein H [SAR86 cluster bacterium BACL1 MAG-120823-bin87]KRP00299.1 MAG: g
MSDIPGDLKFLSSHEWVRVEVDGTVTVGISDHAQDLLGDIVFVELPEVGQSIDAESDAAIVESVKAASDVYSPLSGEVIEVNSLLEDQPEIINSSPYDDGWFYKMSPSDLSEIDNLLSPEDYSAVCED